ncbi:MAG: DNA repair protein RecO [Tepidisphaeraceae bacterium]|jgi:DNA repair protein RecO (recombination protein O)
MPLVVDRSICLRKLEFSETSQILTLFSQHHGLVPVIAKGAHRRTKAGASKFDGGVDLLDVGQAIFTKDSSKELATLTEWKLEEGHLELRHDLRGMHLGLYAAELVSVFIEEHDPHEVIFSRFLEVLGQLGGPRKEEEFLAFELDLLREAGYVPELHQCVHCGAGTEHLVYFSVSAGGAVCRQCRARVSDCFGLDVRLLRLIQAISRPIGPTRRLPQLTRHQTDPLNSLLARHMEHSLSKRLRMPRYVLEGYRSRVYRQESPDLRGTGSGLPA